MMDLQEIQKQIRADAELLKQQLAHEEAIRSGVDDSDVLYPIAPVPVSPLVFDPSPVARSDGSYHYRELACFEDEGFVDVAYRTLLRHGPDPEGLAHYARLLRSGKHKAEILVRMRYSLEGRTQKIRLRGLFVPAALAGLGYIPVIGYISRWIVELFWLPRTLQRLRSNAEQSRRHTIKILSRLANKTNEQSRALNRLIQANRGQ